MNLRRLWRRQPAPRRAARGDVHSSHAAIAALARALDAPQSLSFSVEKARLAGRSAIYVVHASVPLGGHSRWVIKQPHGDWLQDDLDSPVSADQEYQALTRLHDYLPGRTNAHRVPEPVALLPEVEALVMEYVPGHTLRELMNYGSVRRPRALAHGLRAAAQGLRHIHAIEDRPQIRLDLRSEAQTVLREAEEKLRPLNLALPDLVASRLSAVPAREVLSRQVWLHGDFGPGNILLADDGSTVILDPALQTVGPPEDDLARFIAVFSAAIRFAPELATPVASRVRRALEAHLLTTYFGSATYSALFELRLLNQQARRWCRLRERAQNSRRRSLRPVRLGIVDAQVRLLMDESSKRLTRSLANFPVDRSGSPAPR